MSCVLVVGRQRSGAPAVLPATSLSKSCWAEALRAEESFVAAGEASNAPSSRATATRIGTSFISPRRYSRALSIINESCLWLCVAEQIPQRLWPERRDWFHAPERRWSEP